LFATLLTASDVEITQGLSAIEVHYSLLCYAMLCYATLCDAMRTFHVTPMRTHHDTMRCYA
jgi:hypothetical protein